MCTCPLSSSEQAAQMCALPHNTVPTNTDAGSLYSHRMLQRVLSYLKPVPLRASRSFPWLRNQHKGVAPLTNCPAQHNRPRFLWNHNKCAPLRQTRHKNINTGPQVSPILTPALPATHHLSNTCKIWRALVWVCRYRYPLD